MLIPVVVDQIQLTTVKIVRCFCEYISICFSGGYRIEIGQQQKTVNSSNKRKKATNIGNSFATWICVNQCDVNILLLLLENNGDETIKT